MICQKLWQISVRVGVTRSKVIVFVGVFSLIIVATALWSMDVHPIWWQTITITRLIHHYEILNYLDPTPHSDVIYININITYSNISNVSALAHAVSYKPSPESGQRKASAWTPESRNKWCTLLWSFLASRVQLGERPLQWAQEVVRASSGGLFIQ